MNRIHRQVWSQHLGAYVVVAETTRSRGKSNGSTGALLAAVLAGVALGGPALAAGPPAANALPSGAQVVLGQAQIGQSGNTLTVQQGSAKAAIDWQSFNIGSNAKVNFVQPSASAVALNRVVGQDPTQILGALNANGQVFILNPNGVLFAPGAQVSAAGVLASTRNMSNEDFAAGRYTLSGAGAGGVVNHGHISAASGGYVALVGAQVVNEGAITAPKGDIRLAAANQVTLKIDNAGLTGFSVDQGTVDALVANKGLIKADGGRIFLTADALDQVSKAMVNNEGVIEARTLDMSAGKIILLGDLQRGSVVVGGTLDASAPAGGDGGFIETSAAHVKVVDGHAVSTAAPQGRMGTWLIDPVDFTVAASGADTSGAQLSADLAGTNMTIEGTGDVHVNDVVAWSANRLTLKAGNNINLNANLNGSGSASLALQYGQGAVAAGNTGGYRLADGVSVNLPTGNNFSTLQGSDGAVKNFYVINSLGAEGSTTTTDLQGIQGDPSVNGSHGTALNYALGSNIDGFDSWQWGARGFVPLGSSGNAFSGTFDGLGHSINSLNLTSTTNNAGVFGELAAGGRIANLTLGAVDVGGLTMYSHTGGLVGYNNGVIENVLVSGFVGGGNAVGGLVGTNNGVVRNAKSYVTAYGLTRVGGLVGHNTSAGVITDSLSGNGPGHIEGSNEVGGLVGRSDAPLSGLHSSADVHAPDAYYVGGLVGFSTAPVANSSASGSVQGLGSVGGLVGLLIGSHTISNSHATGAVTGSGDYVGGLLGYTEQGSVIGSSASGAVNGFDSVGGLAGYALTVQDSHATGAVTGHNQVGGLVGRTKMGGNHGTALGSVADSSATGVVNGTGDYVGGLVGYHSSVLSGSSAAGAVTGIDLVGGLVGYAEVGSTIGTSQASGNVSGNHNIGGLVGDSYAAVSGSSASGAVSGQGAVGGLIGRVEFESTLIGNHASGNVLGGVYIGGFVGINDGLLDGASNAATGMVTGSGSGIGGFVGLNNSSGTVSGVSAANAVTGTGDGAANIGGVVGSNAGTITLSRATNTVLAGGNKVGGIAGINTGIVTSSYSTGPVTGGSFVGGLVGKNEGSISNVYSTASVAGAASVGGLIGQHKVGGLENAYASGAVSGNDGVGGLIGQGGGNVRYTYASGAVSGAGANIGGLVGNRGGGAVSDSFFNLDSSGQAHSVGDHLANGELALGKSEAQMRMASTFTGWNLSAGGAHDTVWRSYDGLASPLLTHWLTTLTIGNSGNVSHVYDGALHHAAAGNLSYTETLAPGHLLGAATYRGGKNVGTYTELGGHYSDQQGYDISYVNNGALSITPATLSATLVGVSKVYDGSDAASLAPGQLVLGGFASGEGASVSKGTGLFNSARVLQANSVSTALAQWDFTALGDTLLSNYVLPTLASGAATITPRSIVVSATGVGKVYDGNALAQANLSSNSVLEGDIVTLNGSAAFFDKNAGVDKLVLVSAITAGGADAGNYVLEGPSAVTSAAITAKSIAVAAAGVDKVYDGTRAATALLSSSGVVAGDQVGFSGSAEFDTKHAGSAKAVAVAGIAASGADAANYKLGNASAATTAAVTPKTITVAAAAVDKVYDGTRSATALLSSGGVVAGDQVGFSGGATFDSKNAGSAKAVAVAGIAASGADAANYALGNTGAATTAAVTPKAITVAAGAVDKVYDGSRAVAATLTGAGVVTGDKVGFSGSAALADANAGQAKAVAVSGIEASGADRANYTYNRSAATVANVAKRALGLALQGTVAKVANGSVKATLNGANYAVLNLVNGETVAVGQRAGVYDSAAAGTGKLVTAAVAAGDYAAGPNTLLGNYALPTGPVSGRVGVIASGADLAGALASPFILAGVDPQLAPMALGTGAGAARGEPAGGAAADPLAPAPVSLVSTNTRDNLLARRAFSVNDGGMRLPQGVQGSEQDASQ